MRKILFTLFALVFMSGCTTSVDLTETFTDNHEAESSSTILEETTIKNATMETTQLQTREEESTSIPNEEEFNQIMGQISNVEAVRYAYSRGNIEQFVAE